MRAGEPGRHVVRTESLKQQAPPHPPFHAARVWEAAPWGRRAKRRPQGGHAVSLQFRAACLGRSEWFTKSSCQDVFSEIHGEGVHRDQPVEVRRRVS